MKTKHIALSLLLMTGIRAHSQNEVSLRGSLLVPTASYGSGFDFDGFLHDDAWGHAGLGGGIGLEIHKPISDKGLNIYGSLDLYYNSIKSATKSLYQNEISSGATIKFSNYINVPISAGLHYGTSLNTGLGVFAKFGPTLNFLKITKATYTFDAEDTYSTIKTNTFNITSSFGYRIEAGIVMKEKYLLSLGYDALGTHSFRSTEQYLFSDGSTDTETNPISRNVSIVKISLGIILNN